MEILYSILKNFIAFFVYIKANNRDGSGFLKVRIRICERKKPDPKLWKKLTESSSMTSNQLWLVSNFLSIRWALRLFSCFCACTGDNASFLLFNRDPVDHMIDYLVSNFPENLDNNDRRSLAIRAGFKGIGTQLRPPNGN